MMSSQGTPVTGISLPTSRYINSIENSYPSPNRLFKVESAIQGKYRRDVLPINSNISTGSVKDSYVEFILPATSGEFLDLSSLFLETKIRITKADGSPLDDDSHVSLIDGAADRLFTRSSVFLNGTAIESNPYFGLYKSLKSYLSMNVNELKSIGRNSFYKDYNGLPIPSKITKNEFDATKISKDEVQIIEQCKSTLDFITNLHLDISSSHIYLLDGVDLRIRLDLCNPDLLINTYDTEKYIFKIVTTKLWGVKVVPYPSALMSLNKTLSSTHSIEYLFSRPLIRSYVYPTSYNSLTLDNIFTGVIPQLMYIFFMKQTNLNGDYGSNGCYFDHANIDNIRVDVNGNNLAVLNGKYPDQVSLMYHNSLCAIKAEDHQMTLQYFKSGRTIHAFDLRPSDSIDTLSLEKSGNLRVSVQSSKPNTENIIIFIVGITTGLVSIDDTRTVKTNYLM